MDLLPIQQLERYTLRFPQEVLLVQAEVDGVADEVMVFKGFSSSLVNPTAFDPDVPVLPETAVIVAIDRLQGPYNPQSPRYLERDVPWLVFQQRLIEIGLY